MHKSPAVPYALLALGAIKLWVIGEQFHKKLLHINGSTNGITFLVLNYSSHSFRHQFVEGIDVFRDDFTSDLVWCIVSQEPIWAATSFWFMFYTTLHYFVMATWAQGTGIAPSPTSRLECWIRQFMPNKIYKMMIKIPKNVKKGYNLGQEHSNAAR